MFIKISLFTQTALIDFIDSGVYHNNSGNRSLPVSRMINQRCKGGFEFMAAGNSVNDEIREQQSKLKGKPLSEKIKYFWDYYKIHTLAAIVLVIIAANLIYTIATQKDSVLDVALVNTFLKEEYDSEELAADFALYAGIDTNKYEISIDPDLFVDYEGTDQYSYANLQKLTAMAAAGTLDVMLANDDYIDHNLNAGIFTDLHDFFTDEELARYEDRLIYREIQEYDEAIPIGIDVRDSKYLISDLIPAWFCPASTCQNPENAKLFLEYLLEP